MEWKKFGKPLYIDDAVQMSNLYADISREDEKASKILFEQGLYNQAVYFLIQSMEKYIDSIICRKIDISNSYFSEWLRKNAHSIEKNIDFLVDIEISRNEVLNNSIGDLIKNKILMGVRFSKLHNNVRYPYYNEYKGNYMLIQMTSEDYCEIAKIFDTLKKTLTDLECRSGNM